MNGYMKNATVLILLLTTACLGQTVPQSFTDATFEQATPVTQLDSAELRYLPGDGGASRLLLRIDNTGAAALRLRFENMMLPAGATVMVYGVDAGSRLTRADGPFAGAGPLDGNEFWTRPIPGSRIIVELRTPEELPQLPFTLAWEPADPGDFAAPVEAMPVQVERRTSVYRGHAVEHAVIDGVGVWEGDILLGRA